MIIRSSLIRTKHLYIELSMLSLPDWSLLLLMSYLQFDALRYFILVIRDIFSQSCRLCLSSRFVSVSKLDDLITSKIGLRKCFIQLPAIFLGDKQSLENFYLDHHMKSGTRDEISVVLAGVVISPSRMTDKFFHRFGSIRNLCSIFDDQISTNERNTSSVYLLTRRIWREILFWVLDDRWS